MNDKNLHKYIWSFLSPNLVYLKYIFISMKFKIPVL